MRIYLPQLSSLILLLLLSYCIVVGQQEVGAPYNRSNTRNSTKTIKDSINSKYHVALLLDPSGFITLGPSILVEPVITSKLSFNAGVRIYSMALIRNMLYADLKPSFLFHGSIRYYTKPKNSIDGFFLGPVIEYGQLRYVFGSNYDTRVMGGELGYRWVLQEGLCLEISDYVALAQTKLEADFDTHWKTDMFIFYLVSFKIGIIF